MWQRNGVKKSNFLIHIFKFWGCKSLIFLTYIIWSDRIHSLNYLRFTIWVRENNLYAHTTNRCNKVKRICPKLELFTALGLIFFQSSWTILDMMFTPGFYLKHIWRNLKINLSTVVFLRHKCQLSFCVRQNY